MTGRRLLLVHAHPDDETIMTGATMAQCVRDGIEVTLVTCTLGEQGEILVPTLAGLAAERADQLGGYRIGELAAAMRALGVTDHRFLGGAGTFRDSGMAGSPANTDPRAFWRAAADPAVFARAVAEVVAVIREIRPQVVITYDPNGGYGHPDHVMAHRVTMAAVAATADPGSSTDGDPWRVTRVLWTADPQSVLDRDTRETRADDTVPFAADPDALHFGVPDDTVAVTLDAGDCADVKYAALGAHATQIDVRQGRAHRFWALSNHQGRVLSGVEHFRAADPSGDPGPSDALFPVGLS